MNGRRFCQRMNVETWRSARKKTNTKQENTDPVFSSLISERVFFFQLWNGTSVLSFHLRNPTFSLRLNLYFFLSASLSVSGSISTSASPVTGTHTHTHTHAPACRPSTDMKSTLHCLLREIANPLLCVCVCVNKQCRCAVPVCRWCRWARWQIGIMYVLPLF